MSEVLLKIGDDRDGQPILIRPDGWLIPAPDMTLWLSTDKVPAILDDMPGYKQRQITREVAHVKWWTMHTAAEAAERFNIRGPTPEKAAETADKTRQLYVEERLNMEEHGVDTNWGYRDLECHFVVRLPDLTRDEEAEFLDRKYNVSGETPLKTADRVYRFAYELDNASQLTDIRNKEKRIDVDRVDAPLSKTRFEEVP